MLNNNKNQQENKIVTPNKTLTEQPPAGLNTVDIRKILSLLEVVSTAPTGTPRTFYESIKLYSNTGTYRVYFYLAGVGWKYTALT